MPITKILDKPIVTEKTMALAESGKYVFRVSYKASKGRIANEIENIYGVNVVDVATMIMPGKKRRLGKTNQFTKTQKWKKAIVKLAEGESISLIEEGK